MIGVVVLTRDDCHHCDHAKAVLDRLTREFPLQVEEVDVNSRAGQELAMRNGLLFPPGIVIDGRPFSYGRPSEGKLRREFDRLAATHVGGG
jgi:glutaredoxin